MLLTAVLLIPRLAVKSEATSACGLWTANKAISASRMRSHSLVVVSLAEDPRPGWGTLTWR